MENALREANAQLETRIAQRTATLSRTCEELQAEIVQRKRLEGELLELTQTGRHQNGVDFHGEMGQSLSGIAFMVKSLGMKLEKSAPLEASSAERIQTVVNQTIASAHDPVQDLVALGIQEATLSEALEGLVERVQSLFEVACSFASEEVLPALPHDAFIQIYNIALEGVVDAIRFSKAHRISIVLSSRKEKLILTVEHDGHPFPTPWHRSLELGLKLMHYRARLIGARLKLTDQKQHQPMLTCIFPSERSKQQSLLASSNGVA
jgi:signal transduction histidine kinase